MDKNIIERINNLYDEHIKGVFQLLGREPQTIANEIISVIRDLKSKFIVPTPENIYLFLIGKNSDWYKLDINSEVYKKFANYYIAWENLRKEEKDIARKHRN